MKRKSAWLSFTACALTAATTLTPLLAEPSATTTAKDVKNAVHVSSFASAYSHLRGITVREKSIELYVMQDQAIQIERADLDSFRELVKKFNEWSKIAVENGLDGVGKLLVSGNVRGLFATEKSEDENGKSIIRCFLTLQGKQYQAEELQTFIKNLDLIPELDRQMQKADQLLK